MAGANRLSGDKLTVGAELCANHNAAIKNLSGDVPERLSGSGGTENHFVAVRAVGGHQIMACSNLPGRESADMLKAEGQGDLAVRDESYPSSLRSSSTCTSYSLEISLSATESNNKESGPLPLQTPLGSRDNHAIQTNLHNPQGPHLGGRNASIKHSYKPSAPKTLEKRDEPTDSSNFNQCLNMFNSCQIVTSKSPNQEHLLEKSFSSFPGGSGKVGAQPASPGQSWKAPFTQDTALAGGFSKEKTVKEEEDVFYAFVILHAPEDTEEAVRIQARLEAISSTTGATFSEDFAEPGRSIFRCLEEAIDNSAFIMVLLTQNFDTHLNETNADSALMNSIEKTHKYNTVIPLYPQTNALPHTKVPLVLRAKVGLYERRGKSFEMKAKKVLASENIQTHKAKWKQQEKQKTKRLREENRHPTDFIREHKKVQELEQERMHLRKQIQNLPGVYPAQPPSHQPFFGGRQPLGPRPYHWPCPMPPYHSELPPNIHIHNAKYIIIGNDSTMTVGGAGNNSEDEDSFNASQSSSHFNT